MGDELFIYVCDNPNDPVGLRLNMQFCESQTAMTEKIPLQIDAVIISIKGY